MASGQDGHEQSVPVFRLPCNICNRSFGPDALERHQKICEKTTVNKRKVFDSAKQRIQGTDIPTVSSYHPLTTSSAPSSLCGKERSSTRSSMRLRIKPPNLPVRETKGKNSSPSFARRLAPEYVVCPTCERSFSDKAADRHISWCREQRARIPRSPPCTEARGRLAARIQYKAPLPGKRQFSPPPGSLHKSWSQSSFCSSRDSLPFPVSPTSPHGVKITGTAITAHSRYGEPKRNLPSCAGSISSFSNGFDGRKNGLSHSSSWEWVKPQNATVEHVPKPPPKTSKNINNNNNNSKLQAQRFVKMRFLKEQSRLESYKEETATDADEYDPYVTAQRQFEELLSGSSSPEIQQHLKSNSLNNKQCTNQVRENKLKSDASSSPWPGVTEKEMEEVEKILQDLAFDDDELIFDETMSNRNDKSVNRGPRRAVSREEALFGTKNSSGSQDSDYGSLLIRRSPSSPARISPSQRSGRNYDYNNERNLLTSTSSSETSLPPLGIPSDSNNKFTRFCHECGAKYPVSNAKFCCECGVKRACAV